ncbi:MAG: ribulose-phosphate 3-epimerase [Eubacteriales bacterium]|nr:ribulose-phosphate 3-epimerase [Eubacteriales bacterium]
MNELGSNGANDVRARYLSPSLLAADFGRLAEEIEAVERAGCKYLHIDVMDGLYVPSISFGMPVMKSIRKYTDMIFDVHLMIREPGRFIQDFADAGADLITIHPESVVHLDRTVQQIKQAGLKVGCTLNPATPLQTLEYVLPSLDMVLLMSVNPGFGGQKYIPYVTEKIRALRRIIVERGLDTDIEVDGGVKLDNLDEVLDAGANIIVAGSAVFGKDTYGQAKAFNERLARYE